MVQLMPVARQRFFDDNGVPLAGGLLYSYVAGTTIPQATYADSTGVSANTNPVVLDADGYCDVWLTVGAAYKFILQDVNGVQQWSEDNITLADSAGVSVFGSRSTPVVLDGTAPIPFTGSSPLNYFYVISNSGAVSLANLQIAEGNFVGQLLTVIGTSDSNTIQLGNSSPGDASGVDTNGIVILGSHSSIIFVWDGANWSEISRR